MHGIFRAFVLVLRLDRSPKPKDLPAKGHDVKSYRRTRERKRKQAEKEQDEIDARARALASSPLLKDALKQMSRNESTRDRGSPDGPRHTPSLLHQTIIEHTDEEES